MARFYVARKDGIESYPNADGLVALANQGYTIYKLVEQLVEDVETEQTNGMNEMYGESTATPSGTKAVKING